METKRCLQAEHLNFTSQLYAPRTDMVRPRTFFDFTIDGNATGRIVFELFTDVVPKTCENFRALCTGERGVSPLSNLPLHYKGSGIHRSIANFMIQGGDFTRHNGKGGESVYGAPFEDEDLTREVDAEGLLVMANKGPDTNGSQWFITLRPCPHLNGKHVVFGRVVAGYDNVIKAVAEVPTDEKDRPLKPVVITHSGELVLKKAPPKPAAAPVRERSASVSSASSDHGRKRRHSDSQSESDASRRHKKRDRSTTSRSPERRKHKSHKHKKDKDRSSKHKSKRRHKSSEGASEKVENKEETEAELDARLEREEKERIAAEKQQRLEELRRRAPIEEAGNGVRYKGRGKMKFRDPETSLHGW